MSVHVHACVCMFLYFYAWKGLFCDRFIALVQILATVILGKTNTVLNKVFMYYAGIKHMNSGHLKALIPWAII